MDESYDVRPLGHVQSPLRERTNAPRQPDEHAPPARVVIRPEYAAALEGLEAGQRVIVITWLHRGARDALRVHPRGDATRDPVGVFATRSPDRPNPIGLHVVTVVAIDDSGVSVAALEAIDGTPVIDIKPTLGPIDER